MIVLDTSQRIQYIQYNTIQYIQRILRRFNNCFLKGFAKNETDKIKRKKDTKERKKRKLES